MKEKHPWGAFNSFLQAIGIFEKNIPEVLSSESLPLTKAYADHIISIFRFFGFADIQNRPTDLFRQYVLEKEDKRFLLFRELLTKGYPEIFSKINSPADITNEFLAEALKESSPSKFTRRKIIAFFKNAAIYAKIPISATFRKTPVIINEGAQIETLLNDADSDVKIKQKPQKAIEQEEVSTSAIPPIILNLVNDLPQVNTEWDKNRKEQWLKMLTTAIDYYYPTPKTE